MPRATNPFLPAGSIVARPTACSPQRLKRPSGIQASLSLPSRSHHMLSNMHSLPPNEFGNIF